MDQQVRPIHVVARFRPPLSEVELQEDGPAFTVGPDGAVESADLVHRFQFDRAFGEQGNQSEVYDEVGRPIVNDVLSGYNATVLAYGPTGSGKTFCMFGPPGKNASEIVGLVPRAIQQVLERVALESSSDTEESISVECSFFEVYCEQVRDFLQPKLQNLPVKEMPGGGFNVEGLTLRKVTSAAEALQILRSGLRLRIASNTKLNQHSSRSHAIFTLVLRQSNAEGIRQSKLTLVDLAGSEKVRKSGSVGDMFEEAKKINSSLSTLGHVIEALADRRPHVPYRDSRLTRILEDSLGGNCRTTLLVACSPSAVHCSETLSSLRFAARAKKVENCARIHVTPWCSNSDKQLRQRIAQLRRELARLEGRCSGFSLDVRLEANTTRGTSRSRAASANAAERCLPSPRLGRLFRAASPPPVRHVAQARGKLTPRHQPRKLQRCWTEDLVKDPLAAAPVVTKSSSSASVSSVIDRTCFEKQNPVVDASTAMDKKVPAAIAAAFEAQRSRQMQGELHEMMPVGSGVTLLGSCKSTATGSATSSVGSATGLSLSASAAGTPMSHHRDSNGDESPYFAPHRSFLIEATALTDYNKAAKAHRPPLLPSSSSLVSSSSSDKPLAGLDVVDQEKKHLLEQESLRHRHAAERWSLRCAQLVAELAAERERRANAEARSNELSVSPSRGRLAYVSMPQRPLHGSLSPRHTISSVSVVADPDHTCMIRSRSASLSGRRISIGSPRAASLTGSTFVSTPRATIFTPTISCPSTVMPVPASAALAAVTWNQTSVWPPALLGERWSGNRMSLVPAVAEPAWHGYTTYYPAASVVATEVRETLSKIAV